MKRELRSVSERTLACARTRLGVRGDQVAGEGLLGS